MKNQETITVFNLLSNEEYTFTNISPLNALISAAILQSNCDNSLITNPITRDRFERKLIKGKYGMSIDNVAIKY